ncbi:hypothetical protein [Flavisphingomonas formosensis]|uniref:hypothetical protein n=1 Tax=Flavisphingomonas formosensis TaxID=861534 RepID=UPI0012FB2DAF|nr:hypothetical protein [Sphingomonas formosensis]
MNQSGLFRMMDSAADIGDGGLLAGFTGTGLEKDKGVAQDREDGAVAGVTAARPSCV